MKYPKQQFEQLKGYIKTLADAVPITGVHPCRLHYIVYQQGSKGQMHNWIYTNGKGELKTAHQIGDDLSGWTKLLDVPETFELYPAGCNDDHVQTAVKAALKQIAN